jgi:hypothetical protein
MAKTIPNSSSNSLNLYLSRSTYPLNSSIVGTITINNANAKDTTTSTNSSFSSIKLYVAGRCRVDSRWHKNTIQESIVKLYGSHPCHGELPSYVEEMAVDCYFKKGGSTTNANTNTAVGGTKVNPNANSNSTNNNNNTIAKNVSSVQSMNGLTSGSPASTKKKKKNQTFCYWSTNVLTLWKNGKEVAVPICHFDAEKEEDRPQALIMDNSEWFKFGTQIAEKVRQGDGDYHDLEYADQDDHDNDYNDETNYQNGMSNDDTNNDTNNDTNDDTNDKSNVMDRNSDRNSFSHEDIEDYEKVGVSEEEEQKEDNNDDDTQQQEQETNNLDSASKSTSIPMNFTFKADLPNDLPPTANASSARYFYSVVLVAETIEGHVEVYQAPFTVVTPKKMLLDIMNTKHNNDQLPAPQQTQIRIGTIHAIAHPTLCPISLSSTYAAEPWRTSVQRVNGGWDPNSVRSIVMEESGYKCAILTIVGGVVMVPGEKVMLRFDFVQDDESVVSDDGSACLVKRDNLPCHMVSACLQGEENALGVTGSKTRSRSYMFDTTYAHVDPECTRSVSLNLSLPLDCPITLNTDLVKIEINCRVDMTVKMPNSEAFKFLTVQFPCQVVSNLALEREVDEDSNLSDGFIEKIMEHRRTDENIKNCNKVICPDVLDDLSMLSMHITHHNK